MWSGYAHKRKTLKQLTEEFGLSLKQVGRIVKTTAVERRGEKSVSANETVVVMDTSYFFGYGIMVFRSWTQRKNLLWYFVEEETNEAYINGIKELQQRGCNIVAVVIDGKKWLAESILRLNIPVQLCHFHMVKTVTRHLTKHPILEAGKELRWLSLTLKHSTEQDFTDRLISWYATWKDFLNEKTTDPITGKWHYTHKRIRAAYKGLKNALPYLFTYQKFSFRTVPNTTNTLDGTFSHLKTKVHVHRGLNQKTQMKLVTELLTVQTKIATKNVY